MNSVISANRIKVKCKEKGVAVTAALIESTGRKGLIYDLEKRGWTPSVEVFEKIADYLDVSVDYLLGRTDKPEVNR